MAAQSPALLCLLYNIFTCSLASVGDLYGTGGVNYKDGWHALIRYDDSIHNFTTIAKSVGNYETAPMQNAIDPVNGIYYYLTAGRGKESAFVAFDLFHPNTPIPIIDLSMCENVHPGLAPDSGQQFVANPDTGDLYLVCVSKKNSRKESGLYKLTRNQTSNSLDIELIKSYEVEGDTLYNVVYPTLFDPLRNTMWAVQQYDKSSSKIYMNDYYVPTGEIRVQVSSDDWELSNAVYSEFLDYIVSVEFQTVQVTSIYYYVNMFINFADPATSKIVKQVAQVDIGKNYCSGSSKYAMNVDTNVWYQLMYRIEDYAQCSDKDLVFYGDLVVFNVINGEVVDNSTVCQYIPNAAPTAYDTCPEALQVWPESNYDPHK